MLVPTQVCTQLWILLWIVNIPSLVLIIMVRFHHSLQEPLVNLFSCYAFCRLINKGVYLSYSGQKFRFFIYYRINPDERMRFNWYLLQKRPFWEGSEDLLSYLPISVLSLISRYSRKIMEFLELIAFIFFNNFPD